MGKRSFFWRLAQDVTANVIAISAAAMIPLVAMVGGGVDASRYYMTTSRMQAACDAGALAARKAMGKEDWGTEYNTLANNFFDENYKDGMFGLESLSRGYTASDEGVVTGTVTGNLPTSLMSIFGYAEFQLSVTCEADINIANTDIVFVLDVTGSMACKPDGSSCNSGSDSKIQALREATANFYDTVDSATGSRAEVRYGIVPYSNSVNVGPLLYEKNPSWLANHHSYQSRIANFSSSTTYELTGGINLTNVDFDSGYWYWYRDAQWETGYNSSTCAAARPDDIAEVLPDSYDAGDGTLVSQTGSDPRISNYEDYTWLEYWDGYSYYYGGSSGWCLLGYQIYWYYADIEYSTTEDLVSSGEEFDNYTYASIGTEGSGASYIWTGVDLTTLYADSEIDLPIGSQGANITVTWDGCIEEAATDEQQTSFSPIPAAAKDLDIDLVPASEDERWKPVLNRAIYYRYNGGGGYTTSDVTTSSNWSDRPNNYCPKAARKLDPFDSKADLESWLSAANGFVATGNTYHDIGMIWGARLISPDGIFSDENQVGPDGNGISRHIVFMTDGELYPNNYVYTPYGVEFWDRRITDDAAWQTAYDNHEARFLAACEAARNKNISVWVVAFGTALTTTLENCATPGRAFHADNNDELNQSFSEIADKIAQLRLTA